MADLLVGIDGSNVFECGAHYAQYLSTKDVRGLYRKELNARDPNWRLKYWQFSRKVLLQDNLLEGHFVSVVSTEKVDEIRSRMEKAIPMNVYVFQRDENHVKPCNDDQFLADKIVEAMERIENPGTLRMVSSDADFLPVYEYASELGWRVEVWGFGYAMSRKLINSPLVDHIEYLENYFNDFSYYQRPQMLVPREVVDQYLLSNEA